jgi:hypothetical protein
MAARPEVLAQVARMLGDDRLRSATDDAVRAATEAGFERLAQSLLEEIAASDDVVDRDSALSYLDSRLQFLREALAPDLSERLREAVRRQVEAW